MAAAVVVAELVERNQSFEVGLGFESEQQLVVVVERFVEIEGKIHSFEIRKHHFRSCCKIEIEVEKSRSFLVGFEWQSLELELEFGKKLERSDR